MKHKPCLLEFPQWGENIMDTSPLEKLPWWGEINLGKSGCGGNEQKKL